MKRALLLFTASLLLFGCAQPPQIDTEAEKAALLEADQAFLEASSSPEAIASFFAEDGALNAPGVPRATGHEAIQEVFGKLASMPGFSLSWEPTHAVVSASGDLGHTVGTYTQGFDGPDGTHMKVTGKYVTVWQKQADGSWKIIEDIFNNDAAAAPAEE